ncbi:hypothetical protein CRYUN_Cryun12cG0189900 [Craigia yunnanensis]
MYIKDICLEGFKSYATRTVVPGFDPFFNAITGLNGSGKSNMLNSICFVLGFTNLQQVRAANLQELVYKQGQAGITKATVSIIFDNSDRSRSPLGYEDHSEITVTRQEILPALQKLRKERTQYMQWANGNAELDRLKRFCVAYEYDQADRIIDSAVGEVERVKANITKIVNVTERTKVEIQDMETNISKLTAEKEATMGGEVKTMSDEVDSLSKNLVQQVSVLNSKEDTLKGEKENAEKIIHNIEDLRQSIEEKAIAVQKSKGAADLKKRVEDLSKSLEEHEKEYQAVLAGKISGNEEKCLEDQLGDAKVAVGAAETELKQLQTKISHCEKELGEKTRQLMSKRDEAVDVENELISRRKVVEKVKIELDSLPYKEGQMEALQKKLKDGAWDLSAHLANVQFTYRDPVKNFDSSKVTAGGKLFNVVVDTENTGKQLLQNGGLRRRVTIIPLNKIQPNTVPPRVQQAAIRLVGKENAKLALSLVGYDEELESAMEYVFGATFVCKTTDAAKEVAFNREIRTPSVTLEGDIFQPSGLLTGGSRRGGGDLLRQLHDLAEAESKLAVHQKRLSEIETKIADVLPLQKNFIDLKAKFELKMHDLSLFQNRAEKNEHHKLAEMVKSIEQVLEVAKSIVKEKQILGMKMKERLVMEREAVIQEQSSSESQLASLRTQISNLDLEVSEQKAKVDSLKKNRDQLQSELDSIRLKMKECDSQISCILKEQQKLQHKLTDIKLERKKLENEVKQMEMEQKDCSTKVDKLIEKHVWFATERQFFGSGGTNYDFASHDPHKAREELDKLQAEQSSLGKRVNKKVMAMFEKAEDEYNDLMSKKNTVKNDKSKIKKTIEELDEEKKEMLKVTWVKVNNLGINTSCQLIWCLQLYLHLALLFIVVSLKEGMFTNANVLFRTKFVDGVSTVQRTVASKPSR